MLKCNILKTVANGAMRIFQGCCYSGSTQDFEQFHSGGEDYNPPKLVKALADFLSSNKKNGVVCLYQDNIERKCAAGEKRIYSTDADGAVLVAEIYLKQNGKLAINATSDIEINTSSNVNIKGGTVNLGEGGASIARVGDKVMVEGKEGVITSGGKNTSV